MNPVMNVTTDREPTRSSESGFTLVAVMAALLPLVGLAGAAMLAMGGRSSRLMEEVRNEADVESRYDRMHNRHNRGR